VREPFSTPRVLNRIIFSGSLRIGRCAMENRWVVWGFSMWCPVPVKLSITDLRTAIKDKQQWQSEGWTCELYAVGEAPEGFRLRATQVSGT
jgi:hypothetical protein